MANLAEREVRRGRNHCLHLPAPVGTRRRATVVCEERLGGLLRQYRHTWTGQTRITLPPLASPLSVGYNSVAPSQENTIVPHDSLPVSRRAVLGAATGLVA